MSLLIKEVDARTRLAGANQMELLLFHLGTAEVFGINVFKVREVMKIPRLTRMPDVDGRIEGMVNIRGNTVPVVRLKRVLGLDDAETSEACPQSLDKGVLIITEYNRSVQAFHVEGVDRIIRVSWSQVKPPPALVRDTARGSVTAVTILEDGTDSRMVLILDVEKILSDIWPRSDEEVYGGISLEHGLKSKRILFADDSAVARSQIRKTLERIGLSYLETTTGKEAWDCLVRLAEQAEREGKSVLEYVQLVVSDIEMPDMDGFTLTRQIRSDPRFDGIPVILHSSLTGSCNAEKGKAMGAAEFITKFNAQALKELILRNC